MPKYKVKRGETLSQIAEQMGIPESQLRQYNQGVQTVSTGQQISLPPSAVNPSMGRTSRDGGPTAYANSYSSAAAGANVGPHATAYDSQIYNNGPQQSPWQSFLHNLIPTSMNEGAGTRKPGNTPNGTTIPQQPQSSGGGASKPLYSPTKYSSFSGSSAGVNNNNQNADPAMGRTSRTGGPTSYANSYSSAAAGANVGPHATAYESQIYNTGPQQTPWQAFLRNFIPTATNEGAGTRNPNNRPVGYNPGTAAGGTSPYTAKGQAGYYSTGPNERKVVTINGQQVRMGPNSTVSPAQQQQAPWWWPFQQNNSSAGGNLAGVRGAVPNSGPFKGAMPVQNKILQGQVFGGVSDPNAQQAFTPQPDRFSYAPNGYNSYTPYARSQPNPYLAPASNAHMQPIAPAPFMTQSQHLMGSSNPMYTGAPFMTSMQALNGIAKFNATPQAPQIQSNFGNYANGNARTGQEAFQQGAYRPGKRWWIRSGGGEDPYAGAVAAPKPVIKPMQIQGINWRV